MQREERVTVQGPAKKQQPDGMSHRGLADRPDSKCPAVPPTPLQTSKWSYGSMDFVGTRGPRDFCAYGREKFVLFCPMWFYSKYSEFCGEFKNR